MARSKEKQYPAPGTPEYLQAINQAASLYHAGKLEEVEHRCLDLLEADANGFNAAHLLGLVKLKQENAAEAIRYFDRALRAKPDAHEVLNNRGNALQMLQRYDAALDDYDKALACKPDYAPALANRGNALQRLKRYAEAVECYDKALALKADYVDALNNRGNALHALLRHREACQSYDAALSLSPRHAEALYNRGNALQALGCYDEAIQSYDEALAVKRDYAAAFSNRGNALQALGRHNEALQSYDRALWLKPAYAEALNNRGTALAALKRHPEALESYDQALSLEPGYLDALNNRALAFTALKLYAEALASYDVALSLDPQRLQALFGRGVVLQAMKRHSEAIESYDKALMLRPDFVEALHNRGLALYGLGHYLDAVAYYDQALFINSNYPDCLNNRGRALQALGHHAEAMESYDKAIDLQHDHGDALLNKSLLLLLLGELEKGWALYEWRWKASDAPAQHEVQKPLWLGQVPIAGQRLLLHAEQGLGDTIQLCRYAKGLSSAGAHVILEVPSELRRLLQDVDSASEVVATGHEPLQYDLHCPLLSLPLACKTTPASIPSETPYLKPEKQLVAKWSARLGPATLPRVGIAWSGGTFHRNDSNRSIPLAQFARLLALRAEWICLQNQIRDADRAALVKLPMMRHFEREIEDFSDTAALIELCDLVICVDTAVAHLAGAFAKPLWLLLPFNPDWRWMTERADSPWYPTAKLFRQPALADWDSVLDAVKRELEVRLRDEGVQESDRTRST
jgi:tetratricopeptide (TPR) repeat protein